MSARRVRSKQDKFLHPCHLLSIMEEEMGRKLFRTAGLLVLTAIISVVMLVPGVVSAQAKAVARFSGVVTLDGKNVPPGTVITAWIDGSSSGPWTVQSILWVDGITRYALDVPADNPQTTAKDGGTTGDVVHFKITTVLGDSLGPTINWPGITYVSYPLILVNTKPGDANGDGVVNMADVTKVQRIILGLDPPTIGADANLDGVINMGDVTKIMMIILGL